MKNKKKQSTKEINLSTQHAKAKEHKKFDKFTSQSKQFEKQTNFIYEKNGQVKRHSLTQQSDDVGATFAQSNE